LVNPVAAGIHEPEAAAAVIERLKAAVGPKGWIAEEADKAPYLLDQRGVYRGRTPLVLRPATTEEVSQVVRICAGAGLAIVPQGGNTGLVGGSVPHEEGDEIVVSLSRMNKILALDPIDYTLTVEAGCVLADLQQAADGADRLFPLSLGAEGSCQIGGNLSSNAGGTAVLRYGNARDLVLGLQVVLPDGRIWDGLRRLRKDNTGYDLKQLFLGAEGTLGIITAAALKLFPRPRETCTALVPVRDVTAAADLLARLRAASGDSVTSFEYMHRTCLDLVLEHIPGTADPLDERYRHYVLIELASGRADGGLQAMAEEVLGTAFEDGVALNAVIAASETQAQGLWRLRETIPESLKLIGGCIRHDVSVPVSAVPAFIEQAVALVEAAVPGVRAAPFGHLGDGNIHFNLAPPAGGDKDAFVAHTERVTAAVYELVASFEGSFSAEHGIGRLKRPELERYKSPVALDLMATIKRALDPDGIMNPGKVI
jgi:D-lactate dehydrogenase (cytochrome)